MSAVEPSGSNASRKKPLATWALMFLAVVFILLLPDWAGTGGARPIWLFALPIVSGLVGAGFAAQSGHLWWALISALWGFFLIQATVMVLTLIGGP